MASDRATLKSFFELNDVPTEGQYADFIDSAPNIVDDYGSAPAFTRALKISIAAPDVLTLASSPVTLVPAPGAGFAVEVIRAPVRINFVAPVFATNQPLLFTTDTATIPQFNTTNILNSTFSLIRVGTVFTSFLVDQVQLIDDKALRVETPFDIASGGSSIDIYLLFRIITL